MKGNSVSATAVTSNLKTGFVGQRVIYHPTLPSTITVARQEARQGAIEGTTIIASKQTAGKGRIKRTWLSPKGSLALSIILYPHVAHLSSLIMLASLAVVHSIETFTSLKPQVKWPNDVLINGRKVCGVLVESGVRRDRVDYAIIGIGMNVNVTVSHFPEIARTATSLSEELGMEVSRRGILQHLLEEVERLYLLLPGGASVYEAWRDSQVMLGKPVQVTEGKTVYEGIAESVDRDGSLLLRQPNREQLKVVAGDVTLRF